MNPRKSLLKLGVNVDHVATLRQARGGAVPDPAEAAQICEKAGADSIVMHLREDRRHIQDADLFRARQRIRIKLNLEMSIAPSVVRTAMKLVPDQATLVPERRMERTTEGGLDLFKKTDALRRCLDSLRRKKIETSLFIDPDPGQVLRAAELGVEAIELHTGDYANQKNGAGRRRELERLRKAARLGAQSGLHVYAGHGLDYDNVGPVKGIDEIEELNIGYAIIVRALWTGLDAAVSRMKRITAR